ncbi:putative membrane protein [Clostridium acetobutylicum]|nr:MULTISPECIES: hypothetical protein [Clostridium]NOV88182.1 putative membrane protein [Clostridium acetobutylicum]NOW13475.1 putative membrane protein [Clostridium acetobutylicum]NRY55851.1 putative membrane protein [Clostridium acetobutylicum]NSA92301.1 putative membrane protein [Clostridium acetobutylicum]NYC93292.1 putative membrane protein [Clostridium acetobutylicum]
MKILRFIIYGIAGWCVEIVWTGLGSMLNGDVTLRAWTNIWMFLIYGLAIFLEPIHNNIRHLPILVRGGIYSTLIIISEYITGSFLCFMLGTCPWHYSSGPFTIQGITRLDYFPYWLIAGLLFEKLHDALLKISINVEQSSS